MPKRAYFGELFFSRAATPAVAAIDTPALEAGSILRLRGRHLSGADASIRIYRATASGALASRMLSTAGGVERRAGRRNQAKGAAGVEDAEDVKMERRARVGSGRRLSCQPIGTCWRQLGLGVYRGLSVHF